MWKKAYHHTDVKYEGVHFTFFQSCHVFFQYLYFPRPIVVRESETDADEQLDKFCSNNMYK